MAIKNIEEKDGKFIIHDEQTELCDIARLRQVKTQLSSARAQCALQLNQLDESLENIDKALKSYDVAKENPKEGVASG